MSEAIVNNMALPMDALRAYCRKWGIVEFALFGSVLRDDFTADSDIDVLVQFRDGRRYGLLELVQMGDELEAIFGRHVDLIDRRVIEASRNYLRRKIILSSAQVVYAE